MAVSTNIRDSIADLRRRLCLVRGSLSAGRLAGKIGVDRLPIVRFLDADPTLNLTEKTVYRIESWVREQEDRTHANAR